MYSTLDGFKTYIWVHDNSMDAELNFYLESAYELLNKLLGVDTFIERISTEKTSYIIEDKNILKYSLYLKNKPVFEIISINDKPYNWKYIVLNSRKVIFKDINILSYIDDYWMLSVKYRHWYAKIPSDLKLKEMMLASWIYLQKWNEWIARYKLWDEEITFGSMNWYTAQDLYFNFKSLYNKRKSFSLPN